MEILKSKGGGEDSRDGLFDLRSRLHLFRFQPLSFFFFLSRDRDYHRESANSARSIKNAPSRPHLCSQKNSPVFLFLFLYFFYLCRRYIEIRATNFGWEIFPIPF